MRTVLLEFERKQQDRQARSLEQLGGRRWIRLEVKAQEGGVPKGSRCPVSGKAGSGLWLVSTKGSWKGGSDTE